MNTWMCEKRAMLFFLFFRIKVCTWDAEGDMLGAAWLSRVISQLCKQGPGHPAITGVLQQHGAVFGSRTAIHTAKADVELDHT